MAETKPVRMEVAGPSFESICAVQHANVRSLGRGTPIACVMAYLVTGSRWFSLVELRKACGTTLSGLLRTQLSFFKY